MEIKDNYELCCHFVNEIITLEIYWILTNHLNKMFGIDFVFTLSTTVWYHSFSIYGVVIVYFPSPFMESWSFIFLPLWFTSWGDRMSTHYIASSLPHWFRLVGLWLLCRGVQRGIDRKFVSWLKLWVNWQHCILNLFD